MYVSSSVSMYPCMLKPTEIIIQCEIQCHTSYGGDSAKEVFVIRPLFVWISFLSFVLRQEKSLHSSL